MDFDKIMEIEINKFINFINKKYGLKLDLNDYYNIKEKRCLARKWDCPWKKDQNLKCDINKQCQNKAVIGNLCKVCYNSKKISMIYERPYEEMFDLYNNYVDKQKRNNNTEFLYRDIEKEVDTINYEKFFNKKHIKKTKIIKKEKIDTKIDSLYYTQDDIIQKFKMLTTNYSTNQLVNVYLKDKENLFEDYVYLLDDKSVIFSEYVKENNVCKEKQYIIGSYRYNLNYKRHLEITIFEHNEKVHEWKVKTYLEYKNNTFSNEILIEKFD